MLTVTSAAQFSDMFNSVSGGYIGSDGFWSIKHPTRDAYAFSMGDTAVQVGKTKTMPNNTMIVWDAQGMRLVGAPLIPRLADNTLFWCGPMVFDQSRLFTFASGQPGDNVRLIQLDWSGANPSFVAHGPAVPSVGGVRWGSGVLTYGGYQYVYGTYHEDAWSSQWIFGCRVYLARVPVGFLDNRNFWEYLTVNGWSYFEENLKPVISELPDGTSNSFMVCFDNGKVKLTSKTAGNLGSVIKVWESFTPDGQYFSREVVSNVPYSNGDQTYLAMGHFELPRTSTGKVLVSMCHNRANSTLADYYVKPYFYRPTWYEIPA